MLPSLLSSFDATIGTSVSIRIWSPSHETFRILQTTSLKMKIGTLVALEERRRKTYVTFGFSLLRFTRKSLSSYNSRYPQLDVHQLHSSWRRLRQLRLYLTRPYWWPYNFERLAPVDDNSHIVQMVPVSSRDLRSPPLLSSAFFIYFVHQSSLCLATRKVLRTTVRLWGFCTSPNRDILLKCAS